MCLAQLSSASVTGVIRDSTGSVVPNVKITLHNVDHVAQSNNTALGRTE